MEQQEPSSPAPMGDQAADRPTPPPSAESPPQSAAQPRGTSAAAPDRPQAAQQFLRATAVGALAMVRYYAAHAGDLRRYCVEVVPFLEPLGDRQREIRISKDDALGAEAFDGHAWRLNFPDCCVVTGAPRAGQWIEETRSLADMAWPFWALVAGTLGGLIVSLTLTSFWHLSFWLLWALIIAGGLAVGYVKRKSWDVTLRFRRTAAPADDEYPLASLLPGGLLIELGSPAAKKMFVQERVAREVAQRGGTGAVPSAHSAAAIPLPPNDSRPIPLDEPQPGPAPGLYPPTKPRDELPPISLDDNE